MPASQQPLAVSHQISVSSFVIFMMSGTLAMSRFHVCMESKLYVCLLDGIFLPCDHGLYFGISLCEISTNIPTC